jgi:CheY-like chemotaxis protein
MSELKTIMIADDDPSILDSVGLLLEYKGYKVQQLLNGNGLLTLTGNLPDLLLLDIWMSGLDGRQICKYLKSNPGIRDMPVILISASKNIESSALEAGADGFLSKPFDLEELCTMIDLLISRKNSLTAIGKL